MMRRTPIDCLVTIHGIGFQQPPQPGLPGYADALHQQLSRYLDPTLLSDDPRRFRDHYGDNGPIYVQSCWPAGGNQREAGLARLGSWTSDDRRDIDTRNAPLINAQGSIAHIALVYSNLEGRGPRISDTLFSASMVAFSLERYAHIVDLVCMLWRDIQAASQPQQSPGMSIRQDLAGKQGSNSLFQIVRQLENDVAAYVYCDELRERVRGFVTDALLRLACREDVGEIIINAHSNGSVIIYDVLRQLPPFATAKISTFITSGSPLRKYAHFFRWGREISSIHSIPAWHNFWDPHDPVADPLSPPLQWRRGTPVPTSLQTLFHALNPSTGATTSIEIADIEVDNLRYGSSGGLQAHNYWPNDTQFVQPLAALLRKAAARPATSATSATSATATYQPSRTISQRSRPGPAQ